MSHEVARPKNSHDRLVLCEARTRFNNGALVYDTITVISTPSDPYVCNDNEASVNLSGQLSGITVIVNVEDDKRAKSTFGHAPTISEVVAQP